MRFGLPSHIVAPLLRPLLRPVSDKVGLKFGAEPHIAFKEPVSPVLKARRHDLGAKAIFQAQGQLHRPDRLRCDGLIAP
jgi:hypothetical protein